MKICFKPLLLDKPKICERTNSKTLYTHSDGQTTGILGKIYPIFTLKINLINFQCKNQIYWTVFIFILLFLLIIIKYYKY